MAGARAVGAAGRGWGSPYAGSANSIRVCVWAIGAPPPRSMAAPLRGASEAGRSPLSGCPPPGGCRGQLPTCCGHGCADTGSSAVPVARIPCLPQGRAAGVSRPACPLRGASAVRRSPSPDCPPSGRAVGIRHPHMLWARVCGCGGPALSPRPTRPVGAACRGRVGGPPPGGVACQRCEGRLVSHAVPPPATRPLGRVAGVPRSLCPRCGRCGRGDPAPAPQRAPLRAGVARRGGGGSASRGVAFHCYEGRLMSGTPPPPTARPLGGLLGSTTHVLWARACGCGGPTLSPGPACPVGAACRGGGGGLSPGGVACRCCEGRLVSGAVSPPAARPLGRAAGVP